MSPKSNGGNAVVQKYGKEHMREIGRKGAQATHSKYRIQHLGTSDFIYVNKETGEPVGKTFLGRSFSEYQ